MKLFINGFGRIGRSVLRAALQGAAPGAQIVGINDIAAAEMCAYLFEFDSVFGPWKGGVVLDGAALVIDGQRIPLHRTADISGLDLKGVDVVLECTGRADAREMATRGLRGGARRVLLDVGLAEPLGEAGDARLEAAMAKLGPQLVNVHILSNLEPFRYGATEFIRKSMLAAGWILNKGPGFGKKRSSTRASLVGKSNEGILDQLKNSSVPALRDDNIKEFLGNS